MPFTECMIHLIFYQDFEWLHKDFTINVNSHSTSEHKVQLPDRESLLWSWISVTAHPQSIIELASFPLRYPEPTVFCEVF
ncbi:hypothetical protein Plhal304r1_c016g0058761 [Plasmopara halstedii]